MLKITTDHLGSHIWEAFYFVTKQLVTVKYQWNPAFLYVDIVHVFV